MVEKSVMLDLHDPRAGEIAEALTNPSCKKVLLVLAEQEMSESELSRRLEMPMNTIGYTVKKLRACGLIEQTPRVLWSVKGKRVLRYRVSNQHIVISPRSRLRGVVPAILASVALAVGIKVWSNASADTAVASLAYTNTQVPMMAVEKSADVAPAFVRVASGMNGDVWLWFLGGAVVCMLVFLAWNWRKIW